MKKAALIFILIASCKTERQVQIQRGTYQVVNNRISFKPLEDWKEFDNNTAPDTIFRLRNTSVRKQ